MCHFKDTVAQVPVFRPYGKRLLVLSCGGRMTFIDPFVRASTSWSANIIRSLILSFRFVCDLFKNGNIVSSQQNISHYKRALTFKFKAHLIESDWRLNKLDDKFKEETTGGFSTTTVDSDKINSFNHVFTYLYFMCILKQNIDFLNVEFHPFLIIFIIFAGM